MQKSRKKVTGRASKDPNFTRLDRRRNQFHCCGLNMSNVYKEGCIGRTINQCSTVRSNPQQIQSRFHCLRIEDRCPQATDSLKNVIFGQCRWRWEGIKQFTRTTSTLTTTTFMAEDMEHGNIQIS
jgi:hypothetical protein